MNCDQFKINNQELADFQTLFLDMNSFFASVEQQVRPELRGQPIGVAPYTGDSGCIIAASREAKQKGVKICRNYKAKQICSEIKIVEARPSLYLFYHKEIKKVIEKFTPYYTPLSIDEFAIRLTPLDQNYKKSLAMAQGIKAAIKKEVGDYLSCSVGVGPSRFLAKMAAESKKPDGLTVLTLDKLEEFYSKINLLDITGVNYRMEARLRVVGIDSPSMFYHSSLGFLTHVLKHPGRSWYFRLRGYEVDNYMTKSKTIGHSHVLSPELRSREAALSVLKKLVFKAGYRIRKEGYKASGVYLGIRFVDRDGFGLSRNTAPFSDDWTFWSHVSNLLRECSWKSQPLYLSVGAFGLCKSVGEQISIFAEVEKRQNLVMAMDRINDEFGADTVIPASMIMAEEAAPDRIPFGQPRYEIRH